MPIPFAIAPTHVAVRPASTIGMTVIGWAPRSAATTQGEPCQVGDSAAEQEREPEAELGDLARPPPEEEELRPEHEARTAESDVAEDLEE